MSKAGARLARDRAEPAKSFAAKKRRATLRLCGVSSASPCSRGVWLARPVSGPGDRGAGRCPPGLSFGVAPV